MWRYFFDADESFDAPAEFFIASEKATDLLGFGNEFWAAVVGALVGGLIALILQLVSLRVARKYRIEDQTNARRALAYSLSFKMIKIATYLKEAWRHFESTNKECAEENAEPWQVFLSAANLPERIRFTDNEMSLVLSLGDADVFNELFMVDALYVGTIDNIEVLSRLRDSLSSELKAVGMSGDKGVLGLSPEEHLAFKPKMIEVNKLFEGIHSTAQNDYEVAKRLTGQLLNLFEKEFGASFSSMIKGGAANWL